MPDVCLQQKESVMSKNSFHNFSFIPIATQHYSVKQRWRCEAFFTNFFKKPLCWTIFLVYNLKYFTWFQRKVYIFIQIIEDKERKWSSNVYHRFYEVFDVIMLEIIVLKNAEVIFYSRGCSDKLIWTDPWDYNKSEQRAVLL